MNTDIDDTTEIVSEGSGLRSLVTRIARAGMRPAHWTWRVVDTRTGEVVAGPRRARTERAAHRRAERAWTKAANQ
jgi:hypothetical protein